MKHIILIVMYLCLFACVSNRSIDIDSQQSLPESLPNICFSKSLTNKASYIHYGYLKNDLYKKYSNSYVMRKFGYNNDNYPIRYNVHKLVNKYFRLSEKCKGTYALIREVDLNIATKHVGKFGATSERFILSMNAILFYKGNKISEREYHSVSNPVKHNAFTPRRKRLFLENEAKKAAFKEIFRQIDADLQQLQKPGA